ncbi:hypothetical protein [Sinimarinibacterium sp. NLF-5-8]|uniref:hypothetical protein n=1 Tax=Sinimarinibacterium sp. NLF-5-8 TaxID=2698684 RepID=UPI00137BCED2|nr:hypothetical protein [Sinimarinibacterium sp. NLF-5-8]QHS09017.1 hypothetical protein GT972_01900 [Sinimarinibacterium sp. NLF-5-8]
MKLADQSLYALDQLPLAVQNIAMDNVLSHAYTALHEQLSARRTQWMDNMHTAINNPYAIRSIHRKMALIARFKSDRTFFYRCILENLCLFSADGRYYLYTDKSFIG